MKYFIGADLGTSSLKLLLVDEKGNILNKASKEYEVSYPAPGWSEQNPEDWWNAFLSGMDELLDGFDRSRVSGIGVGGQMHGLVALDKDDNIIRPCILWNDGRTAKETAWLNEAVGEEFLAENTANIAFAGFTAPKILWMREHEPENFAKISKIMLPKDYLNYLLTGKHCCDYSDASGMLLLDVGEKKWSKRMLELCGITEEQMPALYESFDIVGNLLPEVAKALGLGAIPVVAGAGDNAAAAVGTGTLFAGKCNISLGTSGTVFIPYDSFVQTENNSIHNFCHANGKFHLMGCILSAASCNKWFYEDILGTDDYAGEQSAISDGDLGANHVYFLPYLMGERSPINDTNARGTFIGMRADTERKNLTQAILEGVAFAIKENIEIAKGMGVKIERSTVCGGGARSHLWLKILANVLNMPLEIPKTEEGPAFGGAMLCMVATGEYESVEACADSLLSVKDTVYPDADVAARYAEQYEKFEKIYPALKGVFEEI
ncbi:MAG: xylulokinase [Clostridia bacterium]|nr:xylulokinase [Clostridia bacterium]